mmetsp:Transcript_586/g.1567  ORF Transcript_586/g.1567 Transcript_586/m.1567 type:complete len:234 (-) Transcript_586:492-1193(-)
MLALSSASTKPDSMMPTSPVGVTHTLRGENEPCTRPALCMASTATHTRLDTARRQLGPRGGSTRNASVRETALSRLLLAFLAAPMGSDHAIQTPGGRAGLLDANGIAPKGMQMSSRTSLHVRKVVLSRFNFPASNGFVSGSCVTRAGTGGSALPTWPRLTWPRPQRATGALTSSQTTIQSMLKSGAASSIVMARSTSSTSSYVAEHRVGGSSRIAIMVAGLWRFGMATPSRPT